MTARVPVAAGVRDWALQQLHGGNEPAALVAMLIAQGVDADFAAAVIEQIVRDGSLPPPASPAGWQLPAGSVIGTADRQIPVQMRLQRPRVALLSAVLGADECNALIELARPRLQASTVIDPATGRDIVTTYRGSEGVFFRRAETPLVAMLEERFSALMKMPPEHAEGLQVLRYVEGGASAPHVDYLEPQIANASESIARSGQRVATLIVYLNDVDAGGETYFPSADLAVQPRCGNGLYFEYCDAQGRCDPQSVHGGAAVQAGEKWVVTQWMRQRPFVARGTGQYKKPTGASLNQTIIV